MHSMALTWCEWNNIAMIFFQHSFCVYGKCRKNSFIFEIKINNYIMKWMWWNLEKLTELSAFRLVSFEAYHNLSIYQSIEISSTAQTLASWCTFTFDEMKLQQIQLLFGSINGSTFNTFSLCVCARSIPPILFLLFFSPSSSFSYLSKISVSALTDD